MLITSKAKKLCDTNYVFNAFHQNLIDFLNSSLCKKCTFVHQNSSVNFTGGKYLQIWHSSVKIKLFTHTKIVLLSCGVSVNHPLLAVCRKQKIYSNSPKKYFVKPYLCMLCTTRYLDVSWGHLIFIDDHVFELLWIL